MVFRDRADAGRRLAEMLTDFQQEDPIVLALPRGGVVVGYQIAEALTAPLDVIVARKLGSPMNPEFGFGAVGPDGVRFINEQTVEMLGLSDIQVDRIADRELAELQRRSGAYRGDLPGSALADKTAILVDDGLATGVTARAAVRSIRQHGPKCVVLAVPVAPSDTAEVLRQEVDEFVCPVVRGDFYAISQFYERFDQTSDEEVIRLLELRRRQLTEGGPAD